MKYVNGVVFFFVALIVQWAWSTYFTAFGLAPQVLLVLTAAVATVNGPVVGQCFGFAWGLSMDVGTAHIFGANALSLTATAYSVGLLRRQVDVSSAPSQWALLVLLTPLYFLAYGLLGVVFERHFLWVGWAPFLACPVINALVAPLGFGLTRKYIDL